MTEGKAIGVRRGISEQKASQGAEPAKGGGDWELRQSPLHHTCKAGCMRWRSWGHTRRRQPVALVGSEEGKDEPSAGERIPATQDSLGHDQKAAAALRVRSDPYLFLSWCGRRRRGARAPAARATRKSPACWGRRAAAEAAVSQKHARAADGGQSHASSSRRACIPVHPMPASPPKCT